VGIYLIYTDITIFVKLHSMLEYNCRKVDADMYVKSISF